MLRTILIVIWIGLIIHGHVDSWPTIVHDTSNIHLHTVVVTTIHRNNINLAFIKRHEYVWRRYGATFGRGKHETICLTWARIHTTGPAKTAIKVRLNGTVIRARPGCNYGVSSRVRANVCIIYDAFSRRTSIPSVFTRRDWILIFSRKFVFHARPTKIGRSWPRGSFQLCNAMYIIA